MKSLPPYLYKLADTFHTFFSACRNSALSLFFPWRCSICTVLQPYPEVVCDPCRDTLPMLEGRICRVCGSPFPENWLVKVCPECKLNRPGLTRIRSAFFYEGPVMQMVRDMKFRRQARYARYFSEEMYRVLLQRIPARVAAIVPVPLHRSREWERTFDQTRLIATHLHKLSGIPLFPVLIRRTNTPPQSSLSGAARRRNLQNAFQIKKGRVLPPNVLLVDDVVTTGATLEACAAVLKKAGVRKVYGLTLARAPLK